MNATNRSAAAEPRRCTWCGDDPLLIRYHDDEWGRPIIGDAGHLERMALEIFQCGLSWRIVLVKRPYFGEAFGGFEVARVARMNSRDIDRLMNNPAIIRNRRKLEAIRDNARAFLSLAEEAGSYVGWFDALPVRTPRERQGVFTLFHKTFRFMGPETTRCYLMGCGKIPPAHDRACAFAVRRSRGAGFPAARKATRSKA